MKLFIALFLVLAILQQQTVHCAPKPFLTSVVTGGANFLKGRVEKSADAIGQAMSIGNQATQLGTKLAGKASYMGTSIGKVGITSATTIGEKAINGGVDLADKGLDFVNTVAGKIPVVGKKVQIGTGIGKWGLNLGQSVGKNMLGLTESLGKGSLTTTNTIVQLATGTAGHVANAGFGLGKKGVEAGAKAINGVIDTGVESVKTMLGKPTVVIPVSTNGITNAAAKYSPF